MSTNPASALAAALDAEDYQTARALLADDCRYEFRGKVIQGADTIIDSYKTNGDAGHDRFDSVEFTSDVVSESDSSARINFTDVVTRSGDTHIHRCSQRVEFDAVSKIVRITHIDLPGEREALEQFKTTHP